MPHKAWDFQREKNTHLRLNNAYSFRFNACATRFSCSSYRSIAIVCRVSSSSLCSNCRLDHRIQNIILPGCRACRVVRRTVSSVDNQCLSRLEVTETSRLSLRTEKAKRNWISVIVACSLPSVCGVPKCSTCHHYAVQGNYDCFLKNLEAFSKHSMQLAVIFL